jgi:hypothetical protein
MEIERDGDKVAEISKRWFRVRDTYGIEIAPGENDALILAATVCIDEMAGAWHHRSRKPSRGRSAAASACQEVVGAIASCPGARSVSGVGSSAGRVATFLPPIRAASSASIQPAWCSRP